MQPMPHKKKLNTELKKLLSQIDLRIQRKSQTMIIIYQQSNHLLK